MNESVPASGLGPEPQSPDNTGLLLSRDLIFTTRVTGTARALGHRVLVADTIALASALITQWHPRVVFVDLAAQELACRDTLAALRALTGPGVPFVAFGSHVDRASLESARAAGCAEVLPRSKFSADLPTLIPRYLEGTGQATAPPRP